MSCRKILNRMGEIGDPCGNPSAAGSVRDTLPSIRTENVLCCSHDRSNFTTHMGHCNWQSLWISPPRHTLSYAFSTSKSANITAERLDLAFSQCWIKLTACCMAAVLCWNPNCSLGMHWVSSAKSSNSSLMINSSNLPAVLRRLIGRRFCSKVWSLLAFGIVMMTACFQHFGTYWTLKVHDIRLNSLSMRAPRRFWMASFGMPSAPGLFRFGRFLIWLLNVSLVRSSVVVGLAWCTIASDSICVDFRRESVCENLFVVFCCKIGFQFWISEGTIINLEWGWCLAWIS